MITKRNKFYLYSKENDKFVGYNKEQKGLTFVNEFSIAKRFTTKKEAILTKVMINSLNKVKVTLIIK